MLSDTPFVELSDTELLKTAHHLPIALHIEGDEIDVVALLDDRLLNRPLVDDKLR